MTGHPNPILLDFPAHLETDRLLLRAPRPGDGAAAYAAIHESLDRLLPWMPWARPEQTVEDVEEYARRSAARFILREELDFFMWRKHDGLFVGGSGLHHIEWDVPRFEIGYWVRTGLEGQGYVTETVNALTAFAFETLQAARVEIRCDARNTRSAAVARRAGYALEACLRRDALDPQGQVRDTLLFVRLAGG
jgi:RimJ/RimL family protein N-acetyltransferase